MKLIVLLVTKRDSRLLVILKMIRQHLELEPTKLIDILVLKQVNTIAR